MSTMRRATVITTILILALVCLSHFVDCKKKRNKKKGVPTLGSGPTLGGGPSLGGGGPVLGGPGGPGLGGGGPGTGGQPEPKGPFEAIPEADRVSL